MKVRMRERLVLEEDDLGRELKAVKREILNEDLEDVVQVLCGVGGLVPVSKS